MDRTALVQKVTTIAKSSWKKALAGIGVIALIMMAWNIVPSTFAWIKKQPIVTQGIIHTYALAWNSFTSKVQHMIQAEDENKRLQLENSKLARELEQMKFEETTDESKEQTNEAAAKLMEEAGSKIALVLRGIDYKAPAEFMPQHLFALAIQFLENDDTEKAAVVLSTLLGRKDSDAFKTTRNYILAGSTWYDLENYELAEEFFKAALAHPKADSKEKTPESELFAQARLWRALVAKQIGKEAKAQYWLRDLIDHHPRSTEAAWVNPQEGHRVEQNRGIAEAPSHHEAKH